MFQKIHLTLEMESLRSDCNIRPSDDPKIPGQFESKEQYQLKMTNTVDIVMETDQIKPKKKWVQFSIQRILKKLLGLAKLKKKL